MYVADIYQHLVQIQFVFHKTVKGRKPVFWSFCRADAQLCPNTLASGQRKETPVTSMASRHSHWSLVFQQVQPYLKRSTSSYRLLFTCRALIYPSNCRFNGKRCWCCCLPAAEYHLVLSSDQMYQNSFLFSEQLFLSPPFRPNMAASEVNLEDYSLYSHLSDEELLQIAVERSLQLTPYSVQSTSSSSSAPPAPAAPYQTNPRQRHPDPHRHLPYIPLYQPPPPDTLHVPNCANSPKGQSQFNYSAPKRWVSPERKFTACKHRKHRKTHVMFQKLDNKQTFKLKSFSSCFMAFLRMDGELI